MNHLQEAVAPYSDLLVTWGWEVVAGSASPDCPESIGVHRRRKNGTLLKGADVLLSYWPESILRMHAGEAGVIEERKPSPRPYRVEAKSMGQAKRFGDIVEAVSRFMGEAKTLAPNLSGLKDRPLP